MYSLARRRTKLKAEVDARNEEKSRQLVERERVLNCRLEARRLVEQEKLNAIQARKESARKTQERMHKADEKRKATEKIFQTQTEQTLLKDADMRKRDLERLKKVEEAKKERIVIQTQKRRKAGKRIEEAQIIAAEILEDKRRQFEEKEERSRQIKQQRDVENEELRLQKREENEKEVEAR